VYKCFLGKYGLLIIVILELLGMGDGLGWQGEVSTGGFVIMIIA
jgi:hypothetical protein